MYVYTHAHLKVHGFPCAGSQPYRELGRNRREARSHSNCVCTAYRVLHAQADLATNPQVTTFNLPGPSSNSHDPTTDIPGPNFQLLRSTFNSTLAGWCFTHTHIYRYTQK